MTTVCLVRHGETDWNSHGRLQGRQDIELNDTGRKQAKLAGLHLKHQHWDAVITSPLKRAKETAQLIANELGIHQLDELELLEEIDYGSASGLTGEQIQQLYPDGLPPDAESDEAFSERVVQALNAVVQTYQDKRVVVVTHGAVIHSMLQSIADDEKEIGKLGNACLNVVHLRQGEWVIEFSNYTDHLIMED